VPGNYEADSLIFQVRSNSSFTSTSYIAKKNDVAGGSTSEILAAYSYPYTTLTIYFTTANTSGLTIANYYYDVRKSVSPDSTILAYGIFTIQSYAGEVVTGITGGGSTSADFDTTYIYQALESKLGIAALTDSLDAIRTLIGTGGSLPDSVLFSSDSTDQRTFSDAKYVDKTSPQTITGQKNFSGTVKLAPDTTIVFGEDSNVSGFGLGALFDIPLDDYVYGFEALRFETNKAEDDAWSISIGYNDWIPETEGADIPFNLGYNWTGRIMMPQWGFQLEPNYEVTDSLSIWEWFSYFNDYPNPYTGYNIRPFQLGVYRYGLDSPYVYTSSVGLLADVITFTGDEGTSLIELRTQTYGSSETESGGNGGGGIGNSRLYILDSLWIHHSKNNFGWLYQSTNAGGVKELIRLDENNVVLLAPDEDTDVDFGRAIIGDIKWHNKDSTNYLTVQPDINDVIVFGNDNGIAVTNIEIRSMPMDTTGIKGGELFADPLTGLVNYGLPLNLVANGDFTAFTDSVPDGWTGYGFIGDSYIEEYPTGKLHYVSNGYAGTVSSNITLTSGLTYGFSFSIDSLNTDSVLIYRAGEGAYYTSAGLYNGTVTTSSSGSMFEIVAGNPANGRATDVIIDNVKVWLIGGTRQAPTYDVPVILDSLGNILSSGDTSDYTLTAIDSAVTISLTNVLKTDTSSTDAYKIVVPEVTSYTTGLQVTFLASTANTDGATLTVNGLSAIALLKRHDTALATGDIEAGQIVVCIYDGTNFQMISQLAQ